jgi:hypothetical protein
MDGTQFYRLYLWNAIILVLSLIFWNALSDKPAHIFRGTAVIIPRIYLIFYVSTNDNKWHQVNTILVC